MSKVDEIGSGNLPKNETSTEELILEAARKVFMERGLDGARMQEIADVAKINKALLHYYFRSKDKLFLAVFESALGKILPSMLQVFSREGSFNKKVEDFFEIHLNFLIENPLIPGFIIFEMMRHPEKLKVLTDGFQAADVFSKFSNLIKDNIESGQIKEIDPAQLLLNLISLSVFPVLAGPMIKQLLNFTDQDYHSILKARKKVAAEFVISSISVTQDGNVT